MESNPRDYGEQCRFDAFCKKVLRNEARAYLRNMKRQREREAFFSDLSQAELDKLCVMDRYPSDSIVFSSHGYDLHIDNELVAEAFSTLPQMEQSILILHCTLTWQTVRSAISLGCPGAPFSGTGRRRCRSCAKHCRR